MDISAQKILFSFIGGLGLFLFCLRFMSDALQAAAGDKMRTILEQGTKTPLRGVLTGTLVTALIQSSSATTVLTVGLVNAGLLNLRQSIGVIMGANIGTTLTAYLIGFNLQGYALPILGLGAILFLFSSNKRMQLVGKAIFGFGGLFLGLSIMGDGMKPLKDLPYFASLMTSVENNYILGVLIGIGFTGIVQSSSATIGVLQELTYQGAVTYTQAVPILFGDNIGTTVTALLASIGASVAARRTALTHCVFNVIGTLIFLPLFYLGIFKKMVVLFSNYVFALLPGFTGSWETLNIKLQIAQTHAIFNISNTIVQLPFIAVLAYIVTKLVPDKEGIDEAPPTIKYIDKRFLNNPSVALSQATRETIRMGQLSLEAFKNAINYINNSSESLYKKAMQLEQTIDLLEREITDYLVMASQKSLSEKESSDAYIIMRSLNDWERIGDHCENMVHQIDYAVKHDVRFSGEAQKDLKAMIELTGKTLQLAIDCLEQKNTTLANQVVENERIIDTMQSDYRKAHIRRLNERICNGFNGAVFLELLGNLERISDHCRNIAGYVLGED